jgi:hypothetical protein
MPDQITPAGSVTAFALSLTPEEKVDWADAISLATGVGFNAALESIDQAAAIFDVMPANIAARQALPFAAPVGTSDALARLDRTHYRTWRAENSPRGYVCGNLPVDAIVDVVEEYRSRLAAVPCVDCGNHPETDGHKFDCSLLDNSQQA